MSTKPTQEQIDTARNVVLYLIESTKKHDPSSLVSIKNLENAVLELYIDQSEIKGI